MKFRVERDIFADAVAWVARTLPQRPPVQVLAGLRLTINEEGILKLASFDYQTSATCEIEAEALTEGSALVQGRLLAQIVKLLPSKIVEFSVSEGQAEVKCGSARFSLGLMPLDQYPALPTMSEISGRVKAQDFADAVNQTTMAASKDDTLPILMSVRMEIDGENVTLLATDRYRLSMREFTWTPADPGLQMATLIDARTLSDVAKSLTTAGEIEIALDQAENKIIGFAADGRTTTSNLMEGNYPPVRGLFPSEFTDQAVIDTHQFMEACRRVSLVAERNTSLRLTFRDDALILEAGQGEEAQASEIIDATFTGEEFQTAYNPQYLLGGLSVLKTPFVCMSFTDPNKPAVMTGQEELTGEIDDSFRYLLMPIRFSS